MLQTANSFPSSVDVAMIENKPQLVDTCKTNNPLVCINWLSKFTLTVSFYNPTIRFI